MASCKDFPLLNLVLRESASVQNVDNTAINLSDFDDDVSELLMIPNIVLARIWFLTVSSLFCGSKNIHAKSKALFRMGTCVRSDACKRIAQSSAERAHTGISSLFGLSSSVAVKHFTEILSLFSLSFEKACSYSPFESINTNFDPLAE